MFTGRFYSTPLIASPMSASVRDTVEALPPSAKLVFKILEWGGPLTQQQIVEESLLSARTARHALNQLSDADLVDEEIYVLDARQKLYVLRTID
jgi:transcription initiation factor IIE alpha subunit